MPPKGKGKGPKASDDDDDGGGPSGTCNQVKVRHILCEKHGKVMEAMKALEGYTEENADGTTKTVAAMKFNKVAELFSEDKAKEGGNLGWKRRQELAGPFAEAAFKLSLNTYTKQPVKTAHGYHIIMVEERKA